MRSRILALPALALLCGLCSCGGGGDAAIAPAAPPAGAAGTIPYTAGVYPASSTFANQCAVPRTGVDPQGRRWPDAAGSLLAEKHFLRSWTNELYLWFSEVPDSNPAATADVPAYFDLLRTPAVLASGRRKDEFHFTYNTAEYLAASTNGTMLGYGISFDLVAATPPRRLVVQYVQPGSPAAVAGITRGAELLRADGYDVVADNTTTGIAAINSAAFSPAQGSSHQLVFRDRNTTATRAVTLAAAQVTFDAVPVVSTVPTAAGRVGYLLFNDHTAASESALRGAFETLRSASVVDLVLDLRYNGGGYLDIASEVAYMIAGAARTAGHNFETLQFNSKHPTTNPVTGNRIVPTPFHDKGQGFSVTEGAALPALNLARVYVLTSDETCSASESIINGLKGVGVTVYQFGGTTCGKPYGFYPEDNCGTTYFSIQFRGVNDMNFGDYAEGFSVTRASGDTRAILPGCPAGDDFNHDLGDPAEAQLRTALNYQLTGACPVVPFSATVQAQAASGGGETGAALTMPAYPWQHNSIRR
ncbi:MAG: S41 family peptidase [Steroidobacteraceae bacterium]